MTTERALLVSFDRVIGSGSKLPAVECLLNLANDNNAAHQLLNLGLLKNLALQLSAHYTMTTNLDTADGLVNSAAGCLQRIDYGTRKGLEDNTDSMHKTLRIWICFEDEKSGIELRKKQVNIRRKTHVDEDSWTMLKRYTTIIHTDRRLKLRLVESNFQ